jgi:3-methyl-2-oxobutanoate hydroxymethyltransferase
MGGFRVQGRTADAAEGVLRDARAIADAGAFCLVLEGVPSEVAARITAELDIPTVGIGAGPDCDGQVLVCNDVLGLDLGFRPRFVKRYAELQTVAVAAFQAFGDEVRSAAFPTPDHSFAMVKPVAPPPSDDLGPIYG